MKQSIYRFRLADPTIFLGKYNRFKSWQEAADGEARKILLSRNFRSRREILRAPTSSSPTFCLWRWGRWTTARTRPYTSGRRITRSGWIARQSSISSLPTRRRGE
ncbi:MAG: hypothetical protein ACLTYN_06535 [Dysosmobacter welbionis]